MARTIRRKNVKHNYDWVLIHYACAWFDTRVTSVIDRHSKEGKKKLAVYHSDAGFGSYCKKSPPHWYRRWRNKVATNIEKQAIHRWKKLGNEQFEVPKMVRVKDASWYW